MKEVYFCEPECVDRFTNRHWTDVNPNRASRADCYCSYPITFDMPASYLAKKPDMTLINMIKVDIDTSMKTKYTLEPLSGIKNALLIAADEEAPAVVLPDEAPPAEPTPEVKDDSSMPAILGIAALAVCICIVAKKRRSATSAEEGGEFLL